MPDALDLLFAEHYEASFDGGGRGQVMAAVVDSSQCSSPGCSAPVGRESIALGLCDSCFLKRRTTPAVVAMPRLNRVPKSERVVATGFLPSPMPAPPPPTGPVGPEDVFDCLPLAARIKYRHCLDRRGARKERGAGFVHASPWAHPYCHNDCQQGAQNALLVVLAAAAFPSPKKPPAFLPVHTSATPAAPTPTVAPKEPPVADPSEKHCTKCGKKLRSNNTRGICSASGYKACQARAARTGGAPAVEAVAAAAKPRRAPKASVPSGIPDPKALSIDDLVQLLRGCQAEVRRRKELLADALGDGVGE